MLLITSFFVIRYKDETKNIMAERERAERVWPVRAFLDTNGLLAIYWLTAGGFTAIPGAGVGAVIGGLRGSARGGQGEQSSTPRSARALITRSSPRNALVVLRDIMARGGRGGIYGAGVGFVSGLAFAIWESPPYPWKHRVKW